MTWRLMLDHLRGKPAPKLPDIPGRRHEIATEADIGTAEDRDALLLSDATDREIGLLLRVSRQRANQLRQALRARLASTTEGTT